MKRAQILFWLLWLLSAAAMVLMGGRVAYQVFYILSLILMLGIVYMLSVYFLININVKTEAPHGITGEQLPVIINLKSMFFLPVPSIVLSFSKNPQVSCLKEYAVTLYPYKERRLRMKMGFRCRGVYSVGVTGWRAGDYFGIFSTGRRLDTFCTVSILPKILTVADRLPLPLPEIEANFESTSGEISGARPYVGTDSIRNIHWKLSAKGGELFTKQFTGALRPPTWVITDLSSIKDEDVPMLEDKLLETSLSLTNYLLGASPISCAAVTGGARVVTELVSAADFNEYYQMLGLAEFGGSHFCGGLDGFDMERGGSVWLVTTDSDVFSAVTDFLSYSWDVKWVHISCKPETDKYEQARAAGALVQHVSPNADVTCCAWMADTNL